MCRAMSAISTRHPGALSRSPPSGGGPGSGRAQGVAVEDRCRLRNQRSTSAPAAAAARLIGADPGDVALISRSRTASRPPPRCCGAAGSRVIVLENDHSSPVLEWQTRAEAQGFTIETVPRPGYGDWTAAILESFERPGAAPVGLASISSVHWSDGGTRLDRVAQALRTRGAAFLIDATHAVGVMTLDVAGSIPTSSSSRPTSGCSGPMAAPSSTWQSGISTACP